MLDSIFIILILIFNFGVLFIKSENSYNASELISFWPTSNINRNFNLKSFTADCRLLDNEEREFGYCTYSVSFLCDIGSYSGIASIRIDGVGKSFEINVNSSLPIVYYNFAVVSGDTVTIDFDPIVVVNNTVPYFKVYDDSNGSGTAILKSTSRFIVMPNSCEGVCTYFMSNPSNVQWIHPACAVVKVNNGRRAIFNGSPVQFNVQKGDRITIDVRIVSDDISYEISDSSLISVPVIFSWYLDSYFTPALIENLCNFYLPSSPFGSRLYPIFPEQLKEFLVKNGAPISSKWLGFLPKNVDYEPESESESEREPENNSDLRMMISESEY